MEAVLKRCAWPPRLAFVTGAPRTVRRRNVARCVGESTSRALVGSLRGRSVSFPTDQIRARLSISRVSHSLRSSRLAVAARRPRIPTTWAGRSTSAPPTRPPYPRRATAYCAVTSKHPVARASLLGAGFPRHPGAYRCQPTRNRIFWHVQLSAPNSPESGTGPSYGLGRLRRLGGLQARLGRLRRLGGLQARMSSVSSTL